MVSSNSNNSKIKRKNEAMNDSAQIPHTPGSVERTKGEALLDLDYAIEVSVMHQRFYERLNKGIALLSLLAGSSAFVTIFHPNSVVVTVAGLLVGVLALVEQVYDFRGKAATHAELIKRYQRLRGSASKLDLEKLDQKISKISEDCIPLIQGLKLPAHNHNMHANGYPEWVRPLGKWEKFLDTLV